MIELLRETLLTKDKLWKVFSRASFFVECIIGAKRIYLK